MPTPMLCVESGDPVEERRIEHVLKMLRIKRDQLEWFDSTKARFFLTRDGVKTEVTAEWRADLQREHDQLIMFLAENEIDLDP